MASQCSRQCFADLSQITSIIKITENIWNCDGQQLSPFDLPYFQLDAYEI